MNTCTFLTSKKNRVSTFKYTDLHRYMYANSFLSIYTRNLIQSIILLNTFCIKEQVLNNKKKSLVNLQY